jgi:hypothetical protein
VSDLSVYEVPFGDVEQRLLAWVEEALELRHGAAGDPLGPIKALDFSDGPEIVRNDLIRARMRQDRVDELASLATRARGRIDRVRKEAARQAEEAYDLANRHNAANRRAEFTTGREKHSDANLDTLEQRRTAAEAERLASFAEECERVIRAKSFELGGVRDDLKHVLRGLQFESSLER